MKTTATHPPVLRTLAAALIALLAVSCEKPQTTASEGKNTRHADRRDSHSKEIRSTISRASGYHWTAGDSNSYQIELGYALGKSNNGTSPDPATGGLLIRGIYHLIVLAADGDTVKLAASMSESEILRNGKKCPVLSKLADSTPAILTLSNDGAMQEMAFPADVPLADRQFLRAIYGLEFQMKADTRTWTAKEAGPNKNSSFDSTYKIGNGGSIVKTREISTASEGSEWVVKESNFIGKPGNVWLESLTGKETISISSEGTPVGDAVTMIFLKQSNSANLPEITRELLHSAPKPGDFTLEPSMAARGRISAAEQIRHEALQVKFSGVPYEVPFTALAKVSNTGNHADSLKALHDFSDMLIARPELAQQVAESLKAGVDPHMSSLLAHSLEIANTEATQKTLASILSHPGDYTPTVLSQAIIAAGGLGTLKVPAIAEALDIIQSSFVGNQDEYPLSDAALFSLSRLAETNPELQQPLIDVLIPQLKGTDEEARCTAVLAMTNTGIYNAELMGHAQNLLGSPGTETRAAALAYFEGATDLGSEHIQAIASLLQDSQEPVQLQAVSTLAAASQHGNREGLAALMGIAKDNKASEGVREAARHAIDAASATAGK